MERMNKNIYNDETIGFLMDATNESIDVSTTISPSHTSHLSSNLCHQFNKYDYSDDNIFLPPKARSEAGSPLWCSKVCSTILDDWLEEEESILKLVSCDTDLNEKKKFLNSVETISSQEYDKYESTVGRNILFKTNDLNEQIVFIVQLFLEFLTGNNNINSVEMRNWIDIICFEIAQHIYKKCDLLLKETFVYDNIKKFLETDSSLWFFLRELNRVLLNKGFIDIPWPQCGEKDGFEKIKQVISIESITRISKVILFCTDKCLTRITNKEKNKKTLKTIEKKNSLVKILQEDKKYVYFPCQQINFDIYKEGLYSLRGIYSCLVSRDFPSQEKNIKDSQLKCLFVENLIGTYILTGSDEAIHVGKSIFHRYRTVLSLDAMRNCFNLCIRSPRAEEICDMVQDLYSPSADKDSTQDKYILQSLRDQIWPLVIECEVELKLYDKALKLIELYKLCQNNINDENNMEAYCLTRKLKIEKETEEKIDYSELDNVNNNPYDININNDIDTDYEFDDDIDHDIDYDIDCDIDCDIDFDKNNIVDNNKEVDEDDELLSPYNKYVNENSSSYVKSCLQLVKGLAQQKNILSAVKILDSLIYNEKEQFLVTVTYVIVLDLCLSKKEEKIAEILFEKMKNQNLVNVHAYNKFIKYYVKCKPKRLLYAMNLFKDMKSNNIKPNNTTYNYIITCLYLENRIKTAWVLLDEVLIQNIKLDRSTIILFLKNIKKHINHHKKKKLFKILDMIFIGSDSMLLSIYIEACARIKDFKRIELALNNFQNNGVISCLHAYGTLIKGYGKCDNVKEAWRVWNHLIYNLNKEPSNYCHGCMFNCLISNNCLNDALYLFNESKKTQKKFSPNTIHYSILIKGCAKEKQINTALELYKEMNNNKILCNEITYNTLINACACIGDMNSAEKILNDMTASNICKADVITYSTLIKGFCVQKQIHKAYNLLTEMEEKNIRPDNIVYNTLLEGYCRLFMIEDAEKLYRRMIRNKVLPSSFTLTILIRIYGKLHRLNDAINLAETLPKLFNFESDAYVYTALIAACLINFNIDKALEYFSEMNCGELRKYVTARTFGTIIFGCIKSMRFITAIHLVIDAHNRNIFIEKSLIIKLIEDLTDHQNHLFMFVANQEMLREYLPHIYNYLNGYLNNHKVKILMLPNELIDIVPEYCEPPLTPPPLINKQSIKSHNDSNLLFSKQHKAK